jgi:hypothetical protein
MEPAQVGWSKATRFCAPCSEAGRERCTNIVLPIGWITVFNGCNVLKNSQLQFFQQAARVRIPPSPTRRGALAVATEARPLRAKLQRMPELIGGFLAERGTSLAWRVQKPAGKAR